MGLREGACEIEAQDVVGDGGDGGKDGGVLADSGCALAQGHVARVMRPVFDPPMSADDAGGVGDLDGAAGEIESDLLGSFPKSGGGLEAQHDALDLDDRRDVGLPFGAGHHLGGVEDADETDFVTVAPFGIDGANTGKQRRLGTNRFGSAAEGKLVVLQLNDEMRLGCRGGLEGFFDSAWRRA